MALVVLLRGVNVGGHRTFRPSVLARELKHLDAVNIGAAGTFVIRAPVTQTRIREELASRLPFETEIMICRGRELVSLLSRDYFANQPEGPDIVRFVTVLAKRPRLEPYLPISFPADGAWSLRLLAREGRFVVGLYRRHMRAVRYLGMLDRQFGTSATTRNWNTLRSIARVLGEERS